MTPTASTTIAPVTNGIRDSAAPFDVEKMFGEHVFWYKEMKARLSKSAYKQLRATIEQAEPLSPDLADEIAQAMKEWALEKGATHFTHWFQPLTGRTAEKHDSFVTPNEGDGAVSEFTGKNLIQGEPDASSLPSGGLRATFEARGYTAYDPSSPAFLIEGINGATLCIPTAFASWNGDALDNKTPLLRSIEALNREAMRAMKVFGDKDVRRVYPTVGAEQEYFLIGLEDYRRRPDLMSAGRTLIGARPPRGQEMEDHYFGSIPDVVLAFMMEVEWELYRLGVPIKTRHNEVAPSQYEIAPLFENANVAADHQQLIMMTLQRLAPRYGMAALLHEKPFAGVNGSGKHCNFSMSTDTGMNLLEPGDTPHENLLFLFFCTAVLRAVYHHQDLLRISIASAGNDHRLGANEAPPAILSVFLGDQLTDIYEQLLDQGRATESKKKGFLGLGSPVLPDLARDAGDRNRTSPFAFTGNKFEFRAVGSSQSISFPITVLNTIVAESVSQMTAMLEAELGRKRSTKALEKATVGVISRVMEEVRTIVFNGDNYSDEWHQEAERRGLLNLRTTAEALAKTLDQKNVDLFSSYQVLTESELHSRFEIAAEQYVKTINIEGATLENLARIEVLPAALRYLTEILASMDDADDFGLDVSEVKTLAQEVSTLVGDLRRATRELAEARSDLPTDSSEALRYACDEIRPAMAKTRKACDALETIIPADLWSLPTYREMLFSK